MVTKVLLKTQIVRVGALKNLIDISNLSRSIEDIILIIDLLSIIIHLDDRESI